MDSVNNPVLSVAFTTNVKLGVASKLSVAPLATVIAPVAALIWKRPLASLERL